MIFEKFIYDVVFIIADISILFAIFSFHQSFIATSHVGNDHGELNFMKSMSNETFWTAWLRGVQTNIVHIRDLIPSLLAHQKTNNNSAKLQQQLIGFAFEPILKLQEFFVKNCSASALIGQEEQIATATMIRVVGLLYVLFEVRRLAWLLLAALLMVLFQNALFGIAVMMALHLTTNANVDRGLFGTLLSLPMFVLLWILSIVIVSFGSAIAAGDYLCYAKLQNPNDFIELILTGFGISIVTTLFVLLLKK